MKIMTMMYVFLAALLSCFASPALFACNQPPNLGPAFPIWAPQANIQINLGGTPSSPEQAAAAAWDNAILSYYDCGPYFMLSGSTLTPTATINMTFGSITASTSTGDDDSVETSTTTKVTRGVTDFSHATSSGGFISTIPIQINSMMTDSGAIQEVIAHELGHTLNLADCNYPGCPVNSSVMEANVNVTTVNATIGQPGPTICDYTDIPGRSGLTYFCTATQPPADCNVDPCDPSCETDPSAEPPACPGSPVIVDVSGRGYRLTDAKDGVVFDIRGNGHPIQIAWPAQGAENAFLALPGADGLVHNGKQLFGNFTPQPRSQSPNGFAALAVYDDPKNGGNGNGMIDPGDAIYSSLRLWIDSNHDGICQPEELHTLASLGVETISLHYTLSERVDQYGNHFRYKAAVDANEPDPAHVGRSAYDVFFVSLPTGSAKNLIPLAPQAVKLCPAVTRMKGGMLSTSGR